MSGAPGHWARRWLLDLAPLRTSSAYARFWAGGVASGVGAQLTAVAVAIQVYDLTGSTTAVSLVGAFALVPMVLAGVLGGTVVDAFDRRKVLAWVAALSWLSTAGIAAAAWAGAGSVAPLYALTAVNATASTLVGIARFSVVPQIVPRDQLPAAAALSGISAGLQVAVGPALGGLLVAGVGFAWTYTVDVLLYTTAMAGILTLPALPPARRARVGLRAVAEGARALARAPGLRIAFRLQVVTMAFGRPQALFPALGAALIGGGAVTVGTLSTCVAVGAVVSSLLSGRLGTVRRRGRGMVRAAVVHGLGLVAFGVVLVTVGRGGPATPERVEPAALLGAAIALGVCGFADNVAGIFRTTMIQTEVPDEVRGRVQGFFTLLLTAGPRLGDVYVGLAALALAPWWAPLSGGLLVVVLTGLLVRAAPDFWRRASPA